jgi:formate-dependent nitrite reductase cytochrome c552 subunit
LGLLLFGGLSTAGVWYYATPKWYRVGYMPVQPIAYSHRLHVGGLGLDCRYCHSNVAGSSHANIPSPQTCMNCHDPAKGNIRGDSPALEPLREAYQSGLPISWVRVHKLPDFVYFNHEIHVKRGVGCVECHGRVDQMAEIREAQPLSMSWCLDCHRNAGPSLRPADQVTNVAWDAAGQWDSGRDALFHSASQAEFAAKVTAQSGIKPPADCSGCHR